MFQITQLHLHLPFSINVHTSEEKMKYSLVQANGKEILHL